MAALRVTQCKQSLGIDGSGLPKGVCERCYRSARRPPLPVPPSPASSHTFAVGLPSPTTPSPLSRAAPCLPCQPLFKPLEERAATAERLLARAHARVRALSEMLATARAASPPSLPQQNALAVGESGNNESLPVAEFLRKLRAGNYWSEEDQVNLKLIVGAVLLNTTPSEIRVGHINGRGVHYIQVIIPQKKKVTKRQEYRRLLQVKRVLALAGVDVNSVFERSPKKRRLDPPARLCVDHQVGMIADVGLSSSQYNKIRSGFGGSKSGMASLPALRAKRRRLENMASKEVEVNQTGAHLAKLRDVVQERAAALWDSGSFVERLVLDKESKPILQTEDFVIQEQDGTSPWAKVHPPQVKDIQVTLGLDKGGDPSSVKIVASVINHRQPNKLANTILVAVCPASKDNHEQVSAMLRIHLQQLELLLREGVTVGGNRRAVRLFVSGDYDALCTLHGHKGPSATMPCLWCLSTRAPSAKNARLDAKYGTLQDVDGTRHPRFNSHLLEMETANNGPGPLPRDVHVSKHKSIEQMPLMKGDLRQVVPIPLHITLGGNRRFLRLCVELVIMCLSKSQGKTYALGLAETLRRSVGVRPTSYHGGVFVAKDCHIISAKRDVVTNTLLGILPQADYDAVKKVWELWDKIRGTLNRAEMIGIDERKAFRSNTRALVSWLKNKFPSFSISPKLHILRFHAPDFLDRFGTIGLYGEQAIKAWHGQYNQNANKYTAETELQSAAKLVRTKALALEAGDWRTTNSPKRKSAKAGARMATKAGDKRLRGNKEGLLQSDATLERNIEDGKQWAESIYEEGLQTTSAFLRGLT